MSRILIIQSRRRPDMVQNEQEEYRKSLQGTDASIIFMNSLDESVAWDNPEELLQGVDGVIFGGSGEFDFDGGRADDDEARRTSQEIAARLRPLVAYIFEHDFPTLGICYGHQIIGQLQGVGVVHDTAQNKVGSYMVMQTEAGKDDPLLGVLPTEFMAQYGHKDSLNALPQGAVLLARGERCEYSALRYKNRIYTFQFHPELTAQDVARKLTLSPGYLPVGVDVQSLIQESPETETLIARFVQEIV